MSREEILAKTFGADNWTDTLREDLQIEFALNPSIDKVENAMEEYAKQECIALIDFMHFNWSVIEDMSEKQVYEFYLQSKQK